MMDVIYNRFYEGPIQNIFEQFNLSSYAGSIYWPLYSAFGDGTTKITCGGSTAKFQVSSLDEYAAVKAIAQKESSVLSRIQDESAKGISSETKMWFRLNLIPLIERFSGRILR